MPSYADEPRRNPFDVIVEIRRSEHDWWQREYAEIYRRCLHADNEIDQQFVGIIKRTRDVFLEDAATIDYLEATARIERRATQALRRIRRRRFWRHAGLFIFRCLTALGKARFLGMPGPAPR